MVDDTSTIQEADIIDSSLSTTNNSDGGAQVLLNLEQMIKSNVRAIAKEKDELKKFREMLESALLNDETYRLHNDAAKQAIKVKSATKLQIMKLAENSKVASKVKELSESVKEKETGLEEYLSEFARISGTNEIEDDEGQVQEIIFVPRLVKKSSYKAK